MLYIMADNERAKKALSEKGCTFSKTVKYYNYYNGDKEVCYAKSDILVVSGWKESNRAFSRFVKAVNMGTIK